MKTLNELKALRDTLVAQRDRLMADFHATRGYLQRVEEEIKENQAADPNVPEDMSHERSGP